MVYSIRVVVEDKESSGGTFSIKVSPTSTIERLQQEVIQLNFCGDHERKKTFITKDFVDLFVMVLVLSKKCFSKETNQLRSVQRFLWINL